MVDRIELVRHIVKNVDRKLLKEINRMLTPVNLGTEIPTDDIEGA